jgi:hypothetical protein
LDERIQSNRQQTTDSKDEEVSSDHRKRHRGRVTKGEDIVEAKARAEKREARGVRED